jgi:hypothetical protein
VTANLRVDIIGNDRASSSVSSARRSYDRFGNSVDQLGSNASRTQSRMGRLGASIGAAVKQYGPLAAAAAGAAVLKIGYDSVKAASAVEQSFGAIDSVFGKNADVVKRWASDAADAVGLAKSEYGDLAATLGAMLKNSGIENYAKQTDNLIRLGADLAATFGGSVSDAVGAVGSLMRGETDPIEQYGVSIKQSDVNARLAAQGLDKLTGKAKVQAEQQARLKLLFQQTTDAQGAFRRESNTLAGAQARLTAKWENAKATLGQKLIPIVTRLVSWLSGLIDGTNSTGRAMRALWDIWKSYIIPVARGVQDAFREVWREIQRMLPPGKSARDVMRDIGRGAAIAAPLIGRTLGGAIRWTGRLIAAGARSWWVLTTPIRQIGNAAAWAAGQVANLIGRLSEANRAAAGGVLDFLGSAGVFGFLRSKPGGIPQGLARQSGSGATAARLPTPQVSLTSRPQITVAIDGRALRDAFRVIVREELDTVARQITMGATA